jgi:surface antigen
LRFVGVSVQPIFSNNAKRYAMKQFAPIALAAATLLCSSAAWADPIVIGDDEGYSRLARWEKRLDDRIADGINNRSLNPRRAWQLQKDLDSIEARVLQSYYESNDGIDRRTFRRYADQLRGIASQLGDADWGSRNIYQGWYDDRGGYGGGDPDRGGYDNGGAYNAPPPPPGNYYREGDYERSCRSGNAAAGTIFGAIAGGLIGGAASHGNGGAIAGGVIIGGLLGNTLSRDIDCDDQRYAFDSYNRSLNGDIGRDYEWRHGGNYGTFSSTREYSDGGQVCRDFRVVTYRNGERFEHQGTACRGPDGNWRTR